MSGLHSLQCGLARAVRGGEPAAEVLSAIRGDGIAAAARLRIYRHHYEISLREALKAIYPVVCRLVDERFFAYAAHEYIAAAPPRRACLHEYGEGFPSFLAGFRPCRALAYLPDVARLEWAVNAALHAPAEAGLGPEAFGPVVPADYPRLVFRLAAGLHYLESAWPVDRIWLAHRQEEPPAVDLGAGGCRLELRQRGEEVVFTRLAAAELALRRALKEGASLAAASGAALACDPGFDLADALRRLLAEGLVAGFEVRTPQGGGAP